jgi:type VI secretion system Hcp family effector
MRYRNASWLFMLCAIATFLPAVRSMAATPAVMTIAGGAQGGVRAGASRGDEAADEIALINVVRSSGIDSATGRDSGRGPQKMITVEKVYGANSQQLEQALAENMLLREVVIAFKASGPVKGSAPTGMGGRSKAAQKLVLKNATITQITQTRNVQQIAITYQAIEVTYSSGGTAATDDWETP